MPLVVTAFCPKDADQALRQAQWIRELGGAKKHELLLVADTACPGTQVEGICAEYAASYDAVELLPFVDHYRSWPKSPNDCFSTAARHVMRTKAQPWFFCEPDCVPLKSGWLDALWDEYQKAGKAFMGDFVSAATAGINVVDHMSGNGIYPADLFKHAGYALIADRDAWDVAAASQIVPQMHKTKLIHHKWKAPPFESWAQVEERIGQEAVVFHANKDGSLIKFLRERKEGEATCNPMNDTFRSEHVSNAVPKFNPDSTADSVLLVKSYPGDYEWASYLMRSIDKFCSGFREVVIISPDNKCPVPNYPHRLVVEPEAEGIDGYLHQGAVKAAAHRYTNAEYITHIDSDCLFIKPVTPETFFQDGKPFWLYSRYDKIDAPWKPYTEKFIGHPVDYEWMRRMPMFVPRYVHVALEQFCLAIHGCSVEEYVMRQPYREWSEFNSLGAIAWGRFRDHFTWINCHE